MTVDDEFKIAESVLVDRGGIVAVGRHDEVAARASAEVRRSELDGRTLMPEVIDSHGHVMLFGLDEHELQLDAELVFEA